MTAPAPGPRLVFFTGGTALRDLSRQLAAFTRNSVHLVTPFDSGGSSAALRRAFAMPAVGDMRNRLLALADCELVPSSVLDFCASRLPDREKAPNGADGAGQENMRRKLRQELESMGKKNHAVWADMPPDFAGPLRLHLNFFLQRMPPDFDPFRACLGNLVLAGGYLHHKRDFSPVTAFFSRLLHTRGVVLPIVGESLHLAARPADGSTVVGQHHFRHLAQPVRQLFLTVHEPDREGERPLEQTACRPPLAPICSVYLRSAAAICYPMGSFYTSVLANLLPQGVGRAVAQTPCPKIFIPNSGRDVELQGLTVSRQVEMLLRHLREDAPDAPTDSLLHHVLADSRNGCYEGGLDAAERQALERMGVRLTERDMVCGNDPQRHDPLLTARALMELVPGSAGEVFLT